MKRPSFQFYPGDWASNPNLKRCTFAERGIWLEVMCLMHDQEAYGVLRWPLKDIAQAVGCKLADLQALARKGVLKGDDSDLTEAFVYVPRSGRKDGDPVTLVPPQAGPIWYSSRMVKDEYVRTIRGGEAGSGESPKQAPKAPPDATPKGGIGAAFGPRGSSSSSSPSGKNPPTPKGEGRFAEFWSAWPAGDRKQDRKKCLAKWQRCRWDDEADAIVAHVAAMKVTRQWRDGYEPAPLTYLNGERWRDGVPVAAGVGTTDDVFAGSH